jgi:tryptophan 2-C-methyltransferase
VSKAAVTLVNPNRMKPAVAPIALDYLGDSLLAAGHQVELLDLCFCSGPLDAIDAYFTKASPNLVGITLRNSDDCYYASQETFLPWYKAVYDRILAMSGAPVVLGGAGFSIVAEGMLQRLGANLGMIGDGEKAIVGMADRLANDRSILDMPGLIYRAGNRFHRNPPDPAPLEELPRRRRTLVDNLRYFQEGGQGGLETKRGCAVDCLYCADPVANGRTFRLRPPKMVADEVEALLSQGVDVLHLCDGEFNLPRQHAIAVCQALVDRKLGGRVRWYAYAAAVPFDAELAGLMRRAGCTGINFGVDSGSDEMLHRLGRPYQAVALAETANACRGAGLAVMFDLMLGGPGETWETVRQTVDLMRSIKPDRVGAAVGIRVYPGTRLGEEVRRTGVSPANPHLHGTLTENDDLVEPIFYISADLGPDPVGGLADLIKGDERFLAGGRPGDVGANYNYNDNSTLVEAIRRGERGAYWDILRRIATG